MGSRRIAPLVAVASLVILGAGSAVPASASTPAPIDRSGGTVTVAAVTPKIYFSFASARVNATAPISAKYTVVGAPKGAKIVMQRTFGTSRVFKTIAKLSTSGRYVGKAPSRGVYGYRIVVRSSTGKVLATLKKKLYSYGSVSLSTLLGRNSTTVQIGTRLFRYVAYETSGSWTYLHMDRTSCRGGVLYLGKTGSAVGTSRILQETADEQSLDIPAGTVTSQKFTLSGKAVDFVLDDPDNDPNLFDDGSTYVDGAFSCYTVDGSLG